MADSTITLRVVGAGGLAQGAPQPPAAPAAPTAAPAAPTAVADATATAVAREYRKAQSAAPTAAPVAPTAVADAAATAVARENRKASTAPGNDKTLGGQLGGLALGMASHQLFGAAVTALGTIPGQRRNANLIGSIGGGAIAGATLGATAGSVVPGLGTAVGAGVGAVIGAASGALAAFAQEAKNSREALAQLKDNIRENTLGIGAKRQDRAFAMTLSTMGRDQRIEAITERANQIRRGEGEMSIENLEDWLSTAADNGKTDTDDYRRKQADLSRQYRRLGALQEMDDNLFFQGLPQRISAAELGDSLGKMGGSVGPQVNVDDANRELIDLSRQILQALQALVNKRADTAGGLEAASGSGVYAAPLATAVLK